MVFIYLKIINDSLTPKLEYLKKELLSTDYTKTIYYETIGTINDEANRVTPVKTGDLLDSILTSMDFEKFGGYFSIYFGAVGGDDPAYHTDPANYAWKVGGYGAYFQTIFREAEDTFLSYNDKTLSNIFVGMTYK